MIFIDVSGYGLILVSSIVYVSELQGDVSWKTYLIVLSSGETKEILNKEFPRTKFIEKLSTCKGLEII